MKNSEPAEPYEDIINGFYVYDYHMTRADHSRGVGMT